MVRSPSPAITYKLEPHSRTLPIDAGARQCESGRSHTTDDRRKGIKWDAETLA